MFPETRLGFWDIFQLALWPLIVYLIKVSDQAPYLTLWYGMASTRLSVILLLIRDPKEVLGHPYVLIEILDSIAPLVKLSI